MLATRSSSLTPPLPRLGLWLILSLAAGLVLSLSLSGIKHRWGEAEIAPPAYGEILYAYQYQAGADQREYRYLLRQALEDGRIAGAEAAQLLRLAGFCPDATPAGGCTAVPAAARRSSAGKEMLVALVGA